MTNLETVEVSAKPIDSLYSKQREDVATMRASLLACCGDPKLTKTALQKVAVMQLYHHVTRVVRYLDMMDKLEDKLYESVDSLIDRCDPSDGSSWMLLSTIQGKLQKSMIESNKLLAPCLDVANNLSLFDADFGDASDGGSATILDADSRDRVRNTAQQVLLHLKAN